MKTISNLKNYLMRAAMLLLMVLTMTLTASATDFITDVMVAGHSNQNSFNTLIQDLQGQGWTDISQDLNQGCGSSSYYIHLLYKTQSSSSNTGVPITDFYVRTGANPPDNLTYGGRTYYLVPCQGNDNFTSGHGDLNAGCGSSSDYIFLYYTKDALSNNTGVTAITFNTTQSGAVGSNGGSTGYDLNHGAGGAYIYMHLTTASGANVVTLSSGSGNVPLQNGHILTGTGGTETQVTIADGATVTFNGVNNTAIPNNSSHPWPGISCLGNATIVLNGSTTNSVKGGRGGSGIHIAANKTLTIQGSGTLNATGGYRGAGIGGGWGSSCGNITISGGTVTATGGEDSAGIGSGYYQSSCGNITITNSVTRVTATKGQYSNNAVGAGNGGSSCGTVTIGGVQTGNITMSPFVTYPYTVAFNANGGTGTMNNQSFMYNVAQNLTANAFTNSGHQFLGWATSATGPKVYNDRQSVSNLTQTAGATVTLYAKWTNMVTLTSQIGEVLLQDGDTLSGTGGQNTCVKIADGATVTFNGVDITDINSSNLWPGISCLGDAVIVLNGGTTNSVKGGNLNPGIHVPQGKTLTIQGSGTLNATGGITAAGIGSGQSSTCGNIIISGGTVTATGGQYAAGIGSGRNDSSCGNITITNGVTRVTATKGSSSPNSIGAGNNSTCGTVTIGNVQTGFITTSPFVTYPYSVSFDANGGTGTMANQVFMYNVAQNLTANAFSNSGHQFLGWATSANGPKVYDNGQSVINLTQTAGATVPLFAKWATTVTLTSQIGEVLLHDGDTLTGTGGQNTHVKIDDGATVTFIDVDITTITSNIYHEWPGIGCLGNAVIVLNGGTTNSVKGGFRSSGIHVAANKTLTIQGSGILNATGGIYAAGIGSGYNQSCGNITISGGTVNATGGDRAAGIGSGYNNSSCGNITITNGVTCVTATKYSSSCPNSIGAGDSSTCGTITIGDVQTGFITMSPFVTYPYTVSFDANGGTGSMADMNFMYNMAQSLSANSFTRAYYVFEGWATSATGPKVYNDGQSVSNLSQESGTTVTLFAKWILDPNLLSVSGNVYTIHTATGWDLFCDLLADNSNGYFTDKTVKLDNDISVTRMAGNAGHEFSGTFEGQGHTLTVNYQNTDNDVHTAPFSYVDGATIQNLVVAGNIAGTANRAAGIVGETGSSLSHVINCVSSVNVSGSSYTGGISIGGNVEITGCVFDGMITGISMSGGFVGYSNNALVISDCLFAPQEGSSIVGGTFYYNGGGEITPLNSYYATPLGTPQGKQAHSIAAGENVTVAFDGEATAYDLSGISAYLTGMVYNSTLYAGEGDAVSLNLECTPPSGYLCSGYQASAGTLIGSTNPYTLTMPNADVTIQAELVTPSINYVDGDEVTHTCSDYTVLTGNETTLNAGWYVVNHDITFNRTLTLNGDVTLILCNGMTMTVAPESGSGITGGSLTLYGQSLDANVAGTLNVTSNGGHYAIDFGNYTQHSGSIYANAQSYCISAGTMTINGGSIQASAGYLGIEAETLTVNGGKVEASSIKTGGDITLGWTNTDDYIRAGSYIANYGDGTISVKSGQAFYYENDEGEQVILSDTLNEVQINAIGDKTLHPYILPINYIDGDGVEYTCSNYTVLTGNETSLDAGWYVVDNDITYDHTLILTDDVTLILCNGKTMTVAPESGRGIDMTWYNDNEKLTIYGQSLNSVVAGTLNVIATNNSSICVSTYTQHSGNVVANNNEGGDGLYVYFNITMNGGSIHANGYRGIYTKRMIVNGGQVEASSINANNTTLGWTNTDDIIRAGSYITNYGDGTIAVKSGQAFYYEDGNEHVIVSGTLNSSQIQAIAEKTLRPHYHPVNYIDGNGEEHISIHHTVLTGNETSLDAGWYVVNDDITYDSTLFLNGDVTLILCNGKTMTVAPESGKGIYGSPKSLTIYSQSLDSVVAGTLNVTTNNDPIFVTTYTQHSGNVVVTNNSTGGYALYTEYNNTMNGGSIVANGYLGIYVNGDMTVNGGSINSSGYWGIDTQGDMTINGGNIDANGDDYGIYVSNNGMTVTGGSINANGKWGIYVSNNGMTVTGGSIIANGDWGIYVYDGMTLNGGSIDASGNYGIYVSGNNNDMTINGGQVETSSINASNITLGWTHTEDSILVGNYHAYETISVKSGQAFYYVGEIDKYVMDTVVISDTLNTNQTNAIAGKTLRPYIAPITVTKDIAGYGNGNGGWHLIASPLLDTIDPATVGNLIADTAVHYDLYRFDQNEPLEWRNYKADSTFKLETGKGYLYANKNDVNLTFNGRPYVGNGRFELVYDSTDERKCWNLVGNPFTCDATLDREYYVMSPNGTDINPEPIPATTPIPPYTAVFVKAVAAGDKAVFTRVTP